MTSSTSTPYLGGADRVGALGLLSKGKVRDVYAVDDAHLLIVTTDRVSAFDVVMPQGIAHKGRVLTAIAAHWFDATRDVVPNHLVSTDAGDVPGLDDAERETLRGRVMLVRRAEVLPVEFVVRGYVAGSGWKEYVADGTICGIPLPAGLEFCGPLPEPILTPTTKSAEGHDEPLPPARARELLGARAYEVTEAISLELFRRGTEELGKKGILLADTKFEIGRLPGAAADEFVLVDEALTPDSSRFWPADRWTPGVNQPSFDKQILRDWLETLDWNKEPPGPELPVDLTERISARYLEVCELVTGQRPEGVLA